MQASLLATSDTAPQHPRLHRIGDDGGVIDSDGVDSVDGGGVDSGGGVGGAQ
ncbi:hypothetical protein MUN78_02620 [Leucobacter allii]|uniref:Uncharacterized protein n=1 Tax=Leucobacter allii TaxID=2932247 RepID=A0ABY4FNA2_9MICO|nr:hypothetical protein [Leucobacter allii]UOQ57757.1 hypothetical protein MUN78_02620 [Leucobacter allii]